MTKKRRTYEPRRLDGRIITSDEIEPIHKEVLEFDRMEAISDPMRELIEDLWPELVHKLPPETGSLSMIDILREKYLGKCLVLSMRSVRRRWTSTS
jgi:hypothetical protein